MVSDYEGLRYIVPERQRPFIKWREKQMTTNYSRATMGARRKGNRI